MSASPRTVQYLSKIFLLLTACLSGWCQVITSIAGTDWLFPGDGSMAVNAPIGGSVGLDVATGPDGSFYIADADNQMVMRVGTDGILHVIAGNGFVGHWGDGGLAVNAALFNRRRGGGGCGGKRLYRRVRRQELWRDDPHGNARRQHQHHRGHGRAGIAGDGGPATLAILNRPYGVAVDSGGNVYFSEQATAGFESSRRAGRSAPSPEEDKSPVRKADGGKATDAALGVIGAAGGGFGRQRLFHRQ